MTPSLHYVPKLESTNTYARVHWDELPHMSCVYCDEQTKGRGRYGRTWLAQGKNSLCFSYVLKKQETKKLATLHDSQEQEKAFQPWAALTHFAALCLCHTLQEYGVEASIKWPNDVLVKDEKLAGILSEAILDQSSENAFASHSEAKDQKAFGGLILGIGINISLNEAESQTIAELGGRSPTAIAKHSKKKIEGLALLQAYNKHFFANYDNFMEQGFASIQEEYSQLSCSLHKIISISTPNKTYVGKAKAFTSEGKLVFIDQEQPDAEMILSSGELL